MKLLKHKVILGMKWKHVHIVAEWCNNWMWKQYLINFYFIQIYYIFCLSTKGRTEDRHWLCMYWLLLCSYYYITTLLLQHTSKLGKATSTCQNSASWLLYIFSLMLCPHSHRLIWQHTACSVYNARWKYLSYLQYTKLVGNVQVASVWARSSRSLWMQVAHALLCLHCFS